MQHKSGEFALPPHSINNDAVYAVKLSWAVNVVVLEATLKNLTVGEF